MQQSVETQKVLSDQYQGRLRILTTALMAAGIVTACSSTPPQKTVAKSTRTVSAKPVASAHTAAKTHAVNGYGSQSLLDADSIDSLESLLSATDMAAVEDNKLAIIRHGDVWRRIRAGFKLNLNVQNSRIDAQRSWFATRQPYIDRLSARASRYLYYTVTEAERRGIPTELALLPVIESSYDPAATSNAAAAGMWQFIPSTGTIYGLRQNSIYDGRRDVVESTRAAYEFLTSLYNQFGSWELALAAYNAGPGRIQQAINRNNAAGLPTDYWSLRLPAETMNYVPRFLAVAQIVNQPENYGVRFPSIANRPHFREIQLPGVVDLTLAASIAGLNYQELYELNPGFRTSYTDPNGPSRLLIPMSLSAQVDDRLRNMPTLSQTNPNLMASFSPPAGAVIISSGGSGRGNTSYSTQQAAALMSAGSVNRNTAASSAASVGATSTIKTPITTAVGANTTVTTALRASNAPVNPALTAAATSTVVAPVSTAPVTNASVLVQNNRKVSTPTSANALAAFANQATLPSSPRIPVAVTPAANVRQIAEPPVSAGELASIQSSPVATTTTVATAVSVTAEPQPTSAEKAKVVAELQALAPAGTQVVDPLDGKIKLTAIQTSQSVADAKGQELKIKYEQPVLVAQKTSAATDKTKLTPVIVNATKKPQGERSVHVVQAGDTLANVANRYGVNWHDVANWNQIDPNRALYVGTSLYLYNAKKLPPAQPVKPTSYTVQSGDSLTAVATRFGFSNKQLAEMNDLSPTSNLIAGTRLSLIEKDEPEVTRSNAKNTHNNSDKVETVSYKVKAGESLGSLANRYNISPEQLAGLNKFSSDRSLLLGQSIKVPASVEDEEKPLAAKKATDKTSGDKTSSEKNAKANPKIDTVAYTVKAGDSLRKLATRFDTTNEELAKLNKISATSMVIVGQKLLVPDTEVAVEEDEPARPATYQVKAGETLSSIAAKFDMPIEELAKYNYFKLTAKLDKGEIIKLVADQPEKTSAKASNKKATAKLDKESEEEVLISKKSTIDSDDTEQYTVKKGESLNSIAAKYELSAAQLAKLNQLSAKTKVQSGQSLSVPKLTVSYTIKRGDTLIKLASKHGVTVYDLAKLNQISPTTNVKVGDTLVVPNAGNRSL